MSWIADAHRDWHVVYGNVVCPLDCGIGDNGCPGCGDVDCQGCETLDLDYQSEAQGIYPEFTFG